MSPSRAAAGLVLLALACAGRGAPEPFETPPAPDALELPESLGPGRPELVVLVAIAGLTPDAYLEPAPAMPTLAALAAAGAAAAFVEPVAPPARSPAHASLVSGRRPASHHIASDFRIGERGVRREGYTHASRLQGPTLWSLAAEAGRPVAALGWPTTVGATIPFLLPDAETARGQSWLDALADKTTPWLVELARARGAALPAAARPGPERDAVLVGVACDVLRSPTPPALLLLALGQVGVAAERSGADAAALRGAQARADAELARLVGCLREIGHLPVTALLVAGDRGFTAAHTRIAPNARLAREGLLGGSGENGAAQGWQALARSNGGSAFVYARGEDDALRARTALEAEARRAGVFRVVPAQEMLALGADPEAWFGLDARPGWVFGDGEAEPLLAPSPVAAAGGYLAPGAAPAPGFVAFGRGVRRGVRLPWLRQIDVAPTAARLLGLELDEAEGLALVGVLDLAVEPAAARERDEEASDGP